MRYYKCYWIGYEGSRNYEGTFEVLAETRNYLTLRIVRTGALAIYPEMKIRKLPKEHGTLVGRFVSKVFYNVHFWEDSTQVHHGDFPYPFIYEPHND